MRDDLLEKNDCPADEENEKKSEGLELKLLKARTILISGSVDREMMDKATAKILYLEHQDSKSPITVYVNSPGGDADSGFAIYDLMRFACSPVRTVCAGLCASAGVIIFLGGNKGQRYSLPHSRFLIHQPSTGIQGQASDIEITAREIIKTRDKYNQIVSDETGVEAEKISKDANRDFWMTAGEAIEYGLVDKIIASKKEME